MLCFMLRWGPKPKEGDKMTEHNEDYWMMKANQGLAWLNENDAGAFGTVLEDTLNLLVASASDATEAERLWGAIRSIAGMLPNSFIKRGRGSSLTPEVQASVDSVMNTAQNVFAPFCEEHFDFLRLVVLPHGKTGGDYADADAMTQSFVDRIKRVLMVSLKENRWDGKTENGIPVGITPPAVVEKEDDSEE